jgi:hypothetical protein
LVILYIGSAFQAALMPEQDFLNELVRIEATIRARPEYGDFSLKRFLDD